MTLEQLIAFLEADANRAAWYIGLISIVVFFIARFVIARGLMYVSERTKTTYDDIIVESLRPFRVAYFAPLLVIYSFAYLFPNVQDLLQNVVLFFSLWIIVLTLNSFLNALNTIYESRDEFSGVSIQGYLDLVKLLFIMVALIFSISIITGESPVILLSGLGALTAVLLLVFQDTILSFVASIRISSNNLIRQGDWIEVPSFLADGDVIDMSLHQITVQNWDKTISVIPTHKLLDTPYKNWRGMSESGGRRIKRSISLDIGSIQFLSADQIERLAKLQGLANLAQQEGLTNLGALRIYTEALLARNEDLHQEGMTLLVRDLAPGPKGIPLEVYGFTNKINWDEYEAIQASIFEHLIAIVPEFDLRIFQEPSGGDFAEISVNSKTSK
jgi:miniconductance mechanosensitive channel